MTLETADGKTLVSRRIIPLTTNEDTEVLGVYRGGDLEGKTAFTAHNVGKGCALFIGALPEPDGVRLLAREIAARVKVTPSVQNDENEAVEALTRGSIVALINKSAQEQTVSLKPDLIDFISNNPVESATIEPFGFLILTRAQNIAEDE